MAEFPGIEEMAKKIAETALDGFEYRGKTIREWIKIIVEQDWIPVSERLPENNGVYIVSKWVSDGVESAILTDANYYDGCGEWYNDNRINWGRDLVTNDILAWMPLPEPYREGE